MVSISSAVAIAKFEEKDHQAVCTDAALCCRKLSPISVEAEFRQHKV